MPRPGLPPTPASSTDLQAKDKTRASFFEMTFTLPPPALASTSSNGSSNDSVKSDSSYHPISPASPVAKATGHKHRKPSSMQKQEPTPVTNTDFSLPPPPTRSRKIIQMKPGPTSTPLGASPPGPTGKRGGGSANITPKKQPSSTSVAGKKIARKTAHSLIERRRRSKMNEEFGVLKDMIPACRDQEMHKLAILQASIDYLRYLEQCVTDLKAANSTANLSVPYQSQAPTPRAVSSAPPSNNANEDSEDDDEDEDLEMQDFPSVNPSPNLAATPSQDFLRSTAASTTTSPAMNPSRHNAHNSSYTSISSLPSPAFSAQSYQHSYQDLYRSTFTRSTDTSPALLPSALQDADHEATAALLMLNTDRRHSGGGAGKKVGRGMSVQDLLSA
ncbi:hypothetical protein MMC30_000883 [Trapelia coarctata]|nr:hypothetical protein [Trapelia coarctata]